MKIGELKKILNEVDDDFDIKFLHYRKLTEKELKSMKYRYPYEVSNCNIEFNDIGYSSKIISFDIKMEE